MTPLLILLLALTFPVLAQPPSTGTFDAGTMPAAPALRLLSEAELPRFEDSFKSKVNLIKAARKTLRYLQKTEKENHTKAIRLGERSYGPAALTDSLKEFLAIVESAKSPDELDSRVRSAFDVYQSLGSDGQGKVVFSSYYQPVLEASLKKSERFIHPIYRKPPDLIEADLSLFDKKYPADTPLIGRVDKDKRLVPYFSRGEIDIKKALAGKGHEIAWFQNRFDVLDLHIQGSGILKLPSGKEVLARYAATNARPYNSVGLTLVKAGVFSREEITHDKLRQYLRDNPQAENWILSHNPRYTFFEVVPLPNDGEPFGTINESLAPSRSIAIDPAVIPLGALAFFTTISPQADKDGRFLGQFPTSRFALCMDTGGAIKTPGRVDIYVGHGKQAATTARSQWSDGKLYILVKKLEPRQR
jgi:membrane-bound lytic murein transglycosylase A